MKNLKESKKEKEWKAFEPNSTKDDMYIPFLPINLLSTSIINDEIPFVKEMRRISI